MTFQKLTTAVLGIIVAGTLCAQEEKAYSPATKVRPLLVTTKTSSGEPIEYLKTDKPEVRVLLVELAPGRETGWHKHPVPCYGYILEGEITVEIEGVGTKTFKAGDSLVETVNTLHNGTNTGDKPVRLVMFVTGEEGTPFTVKKK